MATADHTAGQPSSKPRATYDRLVEGFIAQLEAGTAPWVRPWSDGKHSPTMPHNAATGRQYQGVNVLMLWGAAQAFGYPANGLQNGSPDGLALIDDVEVRVLDALSYEGPITAATITGFPGTVNLVEGSPATAADEITLTNSMQRSPNGSDTNNAAVDWVVASPTPGLPNL